MVRVALDAMGGDHAPSTEVEGAVRALAELPPNFAIQLVGQAAAVEAELAKYPDVDRTRIAVVDAPEVIGMAEKPLEAVRKKRKSSIVVGLGLQAAGQVQAFISAGNTGAVLAASTIVLGLHPGVERATVGTLLPTVEGPVLMLDAGANVECSARELVGFAYLGTLYVRDILGRPNPAVGLLNVGEEEGKGTAVVKEAHQSLKQAAGINYVGNIEGRDILGGHQKLGRVDVVVCDGFVGNVVLKFYESVLGLVRHLAEREGLWDRPEARKAFRMLDYSQYGGAPLLGVKGNSIICHGSSNANAILNAIRVAVQAAEIDLSQHIGAEFASHAGTA
ncbi:MAG: phosphate acyltransferase PlsX [Gemmatimonadales bacterium]|nr:phosphate acyltransferase PlsX [Gemmatimonadales bacterium]MDX2060480.1 phosphate acyltransferase PlsX [Gemmatimonadales bacterium]